jgi:glycosyltransferase involved in cell wall biosynthesis
VFDQNPDTDAVQRTTNERIRVMRVVARMVASGTARQVTTLCRGLDHDRFDHRLLTGFVDQGEADYLELRAPDVEFTRVADLGRSVHVSADVRAFAQLLRETRAFRPHVVHTHTAKAGVLGRAVARLVGVPVVIHTFHGHLLHGYFGRTGTRAVVETERLLAHVSTRLLSVGSQVRDDLLAAGIGRAEQYDVVPPGVDLDRPVPPTAEARVALGLPLGAPVVVFMGRIAPVKRLDRLLATAELVLRRVPGALFVIAGGGELDERVQKRADALGSAVRFLGWRSDIENVIGASDLVLLTSDNEGMPVTLIEAGLAGRPAVTTNVGSAPEVILDGRTGFVRRRDAGELADAVVTLLMDADLRWRMGRAARSHTETHFSAPRLVEDTERIYEAALARYRARLSSTTLAPPGV